MQKSGLSIFTTQAASFLLIIIALAAAFSVFFFSTAKSHLERQVGAKLMDIARISARNAPFERLDLIKIGDDESRMVLRLKEKLGEIREAAGVENIIIFGTDRRSLLDLRPGYAIGSACDLPRFDESFTAGLGRGQAVSSRSYRSPAGKFFISAYAPILNPNGELFAIVGVDGGAGEVGIIEQMRTRLYWIAALLAVFASIFALFLARTLTRPIRGISETAKRIGGGDYEARVLLPATAELRTMADSINAMARQVQMRDKQLKEMSANVAHEIRNPLNSLKLQLTLLGEELGDVIDGPPPESLETLHHEIAKLNRFLTEFLTYSRSITLVRNKVSPADLAVNAAEMAAGEATEQEVAIKVAAEALLPDLFVDRDRLEQSLLNIVLNAVQASGPNGRVDIKVRNAKDGAFVEFITTDNGFGIQNDRLEEIFEPFYTTKESGTGLGLSNARRIIHEHGGTITARNLPQGGAEISVRIPSNQSMKEEV